METNDDGPVVSHSSAQNNNGPAVNHPPGPSVLLTLVGENHDGPTICNPVFGDFCLIGLVGAKKNEQQIQLRVLLLCYSQ